MDFIERDGKRSSQVAGKTIFAAAAAGVDPGLAERISAVDNWRKDYIEPVRDLVAAGARSPKNALKIAETGLPAVHENLVFQDERGERALVETFADLPVAPKTDSFIGHGERGQRLEFPYRGTMLRGDALRSQIDLWVATNKIEPSVAANLTMVLDNPDWLDLSDHKVVLLGAGSEMGPLDALCSFGAHVIAIDLPRRDLWERIFATGRAGSGRLSFPVHADVPGIDLMSGAPEARSWLETFDGPLTIGNYVYADGSSFALLAGIVDALIAEILAAHPDTSLAYLATPTDVFAVPAEVVEAALQGTGPFGKALRALSRGSLYEPSYPDTIASEDGRAWGIYDCLVAQQGANYALAKALQRWRATQARERGTLVSANVAPATRTKSVTKNKVLASAYAGAHRFGVEIFEPATSRALMAALLVHDLRDPQAAGNPQVELAHPYDLFVDGAAHGGLWRLPHAPRSVLPLAVLWGLLRRKG